MVIEPGYYEDGEFGCRIENLIVVKPTETKVLHHNSFIASFIVLLFHFSISLGVKHI